MKNKINMGNKEFEKKNWKIKAELEGFFISSVILILVGTIFSTGFATAVTYSSSSAVSTRYQSAPTFQTYYGKNVNTYWPILAEKENCTARQDFMLQMAPFGCQPAVVRSDLLAEQDVPVFCQINAIDINPLIKVEQIKNIQFRGQYPPEVSGAGFHPARAALRSQSTLLGSPLVNNVGYVVVVLKRQPEEAKLPDSVNVSLQAYIEYEAGNAYGIGRSDFVLEESSYENWESEKLRNSFWNGRYFVRLESADQNYAEVSIYNGDRKVITTRVEKGKTSNDFFMPGMYCRAGLKIAYDDYIAAQKKARIEVSSGNSFDSFDVYEGSNFFDGRCTVRRIDINADGETGRVIGSCAGKQFVLELKTGSNQTGTNSIFINGRAYTIEKIGTKYWIDLTNYTDAGIKGKYFYENSILFKEEGNIQITDSNGTLVGDIKSEQRAFYQNFYLLVKNFVGSDTTKGAKSQSSSYFDQAIQSYERVADDYPGEGDGIHGKEALQKGIKLAKDMKDDITRARLINRYLGLYPGDDQAEAYKAELETLRQFDGSFAGEAIEFDNNVRVLRLVSLKAPAKKSYADLTVQGRGMRLALESSKNLTDGDKEVGIIKLEKIDIDKAEVGAYCYQRGSVNASLRKESYLLKITDAPRKICGVDVRLDSTDVERAAKIRLIPKADGSRTETNLTVFVGIEKRAIQLTPDKVAEKIERLNKTIEKWEKITKTLGKVISGLKGACFATAALLTFKNLMTGFSGEAIARQEVMNGDNGWTQRCKALVPGTYPTMDACYLAKSSEIDSDVAKTTAAINKVNAKIQQIQNGETTSTDIFGKSVNTENVRKKLAQSIKQDYAGKTINLGDKTWTYANGSTTKQVPIEELLSDDNVNNGLISTEAMRSLMLNAELQKQGGLNPGMVNNTNDKLVDVAERVNSNMVVNWEFQKNRKDQSNGYPAAFEAVSQNAQTRYASVKPLNNELRAQTGLSDKVTHFAVVRVNPGMSQQGRNNSRYEGGMYNLGLEGDPQTGTYSIKEVTKQGNSTKLDPIGFASTYNLGNLKSMDSASYQNEIQASDRYVRYYETEPYKGMPAIVPFDTKAGWYAATQQTLPAFGGIGAFDASGRVTSFWICNVGKNGRIQFDSGFGDDLCQQVNLNTGQPLNAFPGLDSTKASSLIQRGQQAIMEAARQYGGKYVSIGGERFEVGKPATGTPSTQCQDFMSPKDCHLMFNVCDPVVCPPSRCNLGGTFNVANVAQTGIIGSIFLCLPNIREGILIPVCLTGIHAGIEGWISIMKNYRDCLQESLNNGRMVGICDQIYSIYLCEFFWNQIAPFVNVLIPKLIEMAYGQGVRGGAEYLSVMGAWQNMQNSIDYFTQSYAANSFKAFQARGIQEVGTEVCKSFISVKSPTDLKTLLEPDSPPQFHAWFDEKTFTTATVPATSQYKVFYHIFAGKDQGVSYNVYLRNPPASGYYATSPTISVASGFIAKGEYASQSRDFTAPTGYKELCVRINNDEECGFKQVSSSFAINYLRDSYIKSEASKVTITSQKECVSGSNNPMTMITPNIQQGVEETISPELYNRGIIRICASDNPGSKTDPTRYVDTGYCDTPQIRCWIDKRSIEQALTQGNVGTLNATLEALDARTKALLDAKNITYGNSKAESILMQLRSRVEQLVSSGTKEEALNIINETNELLMSDKLFWNNHKAQTLIIRGDAQGWIAVSYRNIDDELRRGARVIDENETVPNNQGEEEIVDGGNGEPSGYKGYTTSVEKLENSNPGLQRVECPEGKGVPLTWSVFIDGAEKKYQIDLCYDLTLINLYNARFAQLSDSGVCKVLGPGGDGLAYWQSERPFGYFVLESSADKYIEDVAVQLREKAKAEFPNDEEKQKEFIGAFVSAAVTYTKDDVCYSGCKGQRSAHPYEVLYNKRGDCEDSAILLAKLFYIYGYKAGLADWAGPPGKPGHLNNAAKCVDCSTSGKELLIEDNGMRYYHFDATSVKDLAGPYRDLSWVWKQGPEIVKQYSLTRAKPFVIWPKSEPFVVMKGGKAKYGNVGGKDVFKFTLANYGLVDALNVRYIIKDVVGNELGSGEIGRLGVEEERDVTISEMKNVPANTKIDVYLRGDNFKEYLLYTYLTDKETQFNTLSEQPEGELKLKEGGGYITGKREIIFNGGKESGISFVNGKILVRQANSRNNDKQVGKYLVNGGFDIFLDGVISVKDDNALSFNERTGRGGFYVYKADYELLQKLDDYAYTYCGLGGKIGCDGTEVNKDLLPELCDLCEDCSSQKCDNMGKCYFASGKCKGCSEISGCTGYSPDKSACEEDLCGFKTDTNTCRFDSEKNVCFAENSSNGGGNGGGGGGGSEEPYMDGTWVRINFNNGNNYVLNEQDQLLWLLKDANGNGIAWINVVNDSRANYEQKSPTEKEWLENLRLRLKQFKDSRGGGGEVPPTPLTLEERFELREISNTVYIYFLKERGGTSEYTGLYIDMNVAGGKIIRNQNNGGAIVGSLSQSIASMRGAGEVPVVTIINDIDVNVNGENVFRTSCLNNQQIAEQNSKLKINFVSAKLGEGGCPN